MPPLEIIIQLRYLALKNLMIPIIQHFTFISFMIISMALSVPTDLLDKWEAIIDYKDKLLKTKTASNPINVYESRNANLYEDIIPANLLNY